MVIFSWNKDLECGIEPVDRQHRELIESANDFFIRYKCGQKDAAADECLEFLKAYIGSHFQCEESFMRECAYPKYKAHRTLHEAMTKEVALRGARLQESGYSHEALTGFYTFLCSWILDHILIHDLDFSRFYHDFKCEES